MFAKPNISFESNIGYVSRVVFTKLTFEVFRLIHTQSSLPTISAKEDRITNSVSEGIKLK